LLNAQSSVDAVLSKCFANGKTLMPGQFICPAQIKAYGAPARPRRPGKAHQRLVHGAVQEALG
ncbi:hypothetical protein ACTNBZ_10100, partial [Pseudoflavonifractor sp. HCP28S3_F10]